MKFDERLRRSGISKYDLQSYFNTFIKGYNRYWYSYTGDPGWLFSKTNKIPIIPLNKYKLVQHLEGILWIARQIPFKTDYFCIDLDVYKSIPLINRLNKIRDLLPNPLILQSSSTGGLHLYYFLKKEVKSYSLKDILIPLLESNGIVLEKGKIEIFPGNIDHLRMPFGKDSFVLDSNTLKTQGLNLKESIKYVLNEPKNNLAFLKSKIRKKKGKYTSPETHGARLKTSPEVFALLKDGILQRGTRHDSQNLLIRYFFIDKGYSEEKTISCMLKWYHYYNHNSKDWIEKPEQVKKELIAVVNNLAKKHQPRQITSSEKLSKKDFDYILLITKTDKSFYTQDDYYQQLFIYDILKYYKKYDKNILELPKSTIIKFKKCTGNNARRRIQYCRDKEILTMLWAGNRFVHRNRGFRLNYTFQSGPKINSLNDGLLLFYKEKLSKMYKRGIVNTIKNCKK